MASANCSVAQGGEPENCIRGCRNFGCCVITQGGEIAHHCLSQLNKRLGREEEPADKCGGCGLKLKEINDRRGDLASN